MCCARYVILYMCMVLQIGAGLWGALMIFCGLVGATAAGVFLDYTKLFKDVAVISLSFAILSLVWFSEVSGRNDYVYVCVLVSP